MIMVYNSKGKKSSERECKQCKTLCDWTKAQCSVWRTNDL